MRRFLLRGRCCALTVLGCVFVLTAALWGQASSSPQLPSQVPSSTQLPPATQSPAPAPSVVITIDQAIELAKKNNPSLQATRMGIQQNKAQEITANLRPNPVLSLDAQYLPLFSPDQFSSTYIDETVQFDAGVGYLFERGKKRQHRLQAVKDLTSVTESQVADAERALVANVAEQFVAALLAKSNYEFAVQLLQSYQQTVKISQEQHAAGAMSKADLLKIQLQTLQFQTDVSMARIAKVQALALLRQYLGFDSVPADFDVAGKLAYEPLSLQLEDFQARALSLRPDLQASQRSITAADSQAALAKANGKQDFNLSFDYTHLNSSNLGAFYFNIPLPIFNRNQGEIARTQYVMTQAQFLEKAAEQQVLTEVKNAYEAVRSGEDVIRLYNNGYQQQAQQSLDITKFSYEHGAASLLDFLDAERSYRATELSYRQALATYMSALEQLRQAVGTRELP
jgi:outer membrane protein, heavy metal efflux system